MKHPELLNLRTVSDLRVSPGGNRCAFLVHSPREAENDYITQLYISDFVSTSPLPVTGITGLIWTDENTLMVARRQENGTQISRLSLHDCTETACFILPFAAQLEGFVAKQLLVSARRPITGEKALEKGYWTVLDELPLWDDAAGYRAKIRRQLFLCSLSGQVVRISPNELDIRMVSATADQVAYAGCIPSVLNDVANTIHLWDGTDHILCQGSGEITHLALGKDSVFFAALEQGAASGSSPALKQLTLNDGSAKMISNADLFIGNHIVSDTGCQGNVFCADGDTLYFVATVDGTSQIYTMTAGTEPQPLTFDSGCIDQLDIQGSRIAFTGLRNGSCHEVYFWDQCEQKITHLHEEESLASRPAVSICCHGIQGWALREETDDKSCPAVLFLHDGPQLAFGEAYHFGMQLLARNGYVVLFANLPGSVGYGNNFASLAGCWGDNDYNALVQFLDTALESFPEIDPSRLAVIGTGYGAYLAAIATGNGNRFAAAICDGVISNCVSMVSTSDHGLAFAQNQMNACAFRQTEDLWNRSPLSRISAMKTPTLLLHGENDRSSHLSQGQMLFTALKVHGVPTRLCIFPGENHSLASQGSPLARDRYHSEMLRWLNLYL